MKQLKPFMRKFLLSATLCICLCAATVAQTRAGGSSSSKTPAGSAYTLSDGSTVSKNNEALSTSTSDYNVVQVTKGTLTMTDCSVTKTGDYSSSYSGDDTSFYGTNSAVYASGSGATINMTGGMVTTDAKGANAVFATNGATISVDGITGLSEKGPMATVEGANTVIIENSTMQSDAEARGILLHQSNSGDAEGTKPVCTVTNSQLTTTNSSAPLYFVTNVTGTLTLTDVTLSVASGKLMSVEYYKRGENSTGHLVLKTTKDSWAYTGDADADDVNNLAVTVGANVIWNGATDADNNAKSVVVTIESGAVWNLTGNSYVSVLTNNGAVNKNGYTLTVGTSSGSGTVNETTGIKEIYDLPIYDLQSNSDAIYTLDGRRADSNTKGIVIRDGKKFVVR